MTLPDPSAPLQPVTVSYSRSRRSEDSRRRRVRPAHRIALSYAADAYRRYPGEELHLFCRLEVREALSAFSLELSIPAGLTLVEADRVNGPDDVVISIRGVGDSLYVVWTRDGQTEPGTSYEFEVITNVVQRRDDWTIETGAVVTARSVAHQDRFDDSEWIEIPVLSKGTYLRYLPALYTRDDLMGRLLMLFESFWSPISRQIGHTEKYFDPATAPPDFLPFLASWLDLVLDENWPEERRRDLLKAARRLYEKRGTRMGLQEYLQIYTGGEIQIIEHKAENLRVGRSGILGDSRALGLQNRPHTFTVIVRLPAAELDGSAGAKEESAWQRIITQIIDAEKPAHTSYTLQIESI